MCCKKRWHYKYILLLAYKRFILGFIGMLPGLLCNLLVRQDSNMEGKTGTWERFNVPF